MPEINEFHSQLQAYALGCLDKTDYNNLRNFIHSGKEYPWQELGEYQNLAALLPCILNMEMPSPGIKDNVARRLYRVQDEIRARKSGDIGSLKQPVQPPVSEDNAQDETAQELIEEEEQSPQVIYQADAELQAEEETPYEENNTEEYQAYGGQQQLESTDETAPEEEIQQNIIPAEEEPAQVSPEDEFQIVTPVRKTSEFIRSQEPERGKWDRPSEDEFSETDPRNKSYAPEDGLHYIIKEEAAPQKNPAAIYITLALLVLLIAGGIYAYLNITKEVKGYKTEVSKLNEEIKSLTAGGSEVTAELQKMLELPDTRIITLTASRLNPGGFGKVIINSMEGAGFLQLGGMPSQSYSLWLSSGRTHIPLGTFKGASAVQYFRFDLPELGQKQKFFLLTSESAPGAERPAEQIYLSGSF